MKNKIIKITPRLLNKLVNEEVSKFSKKAKITEKFGPFDASGEDDDKQTGMHTWNFEETARELMEQALEPVVGEFTTLVGSIAYEAGSTGGVEDDEQMHMLVNDYANDMKTELLAVIEKYMKLAVEETAGFL